ncbi:MAG TPA: CmcJ/NvfI family oxidoreductase [Acetobacteraceae bacterium]|nr:CmcJ/NvfI family oxidoreductase [Acetobacteraceae bacterium]
MDTHVPTTALTGVEGEFHYLSPTTERPHNYTYDPPPGVPRSNAVYEGHRLFVRNARPIAGDASLDREGFALVHHESVMRDFYNEDQLRETYYPESARLVAEATGAERVIVFDHTIRRRIWGAEDRTAGTPRQPVGRVHNDYTETSAPQRVRDLMGAEADTLLQRRFEIVNVWRPITGPLRDAPLGVCDARTVDPADWVVSDLIYPDRRGETFAVRFNPAHHWWYVPDMLPNEALLLKCFDSARDGRARFAPHSAFEDPTAPADKLPRESIELRTLVFHAA